jgi:DNA-binding transcriptional ArsR family regulator
MYVKADASVYRLLGDEARLRILRLLDRERLNVSELTSILGIAQSGVSRHLGLLHDAGLVAEEREGGFTYYRTPEGEGRPVWTLLREQFRTNGADPLTRADDARLHEVLRIRKENFEVHGSVAAQLVPGRSWAAWARALGHLLPPLDVADLGCGEGYLTIEMAHWARKVTAIDRSADVLRRAKELASRRGVRNIEWKRGEIEQVPLVDGSVDLVLLSQALHHAATPEVALAEAVRITRDKVLILDLRAHEETWVKKRLGDRWLGFDDGELAALMRGAGLSDVRVEVGARRIGDPFTVLIGSGIKTQSAQRPQSAQR